MEDLTFWMGLAFSFPIAIIANLITPKIKNKLEASGDRKLRKKMETLQSDLKTIEGFKANPQDLSVFLLSIIIAVQNRTKLKNHH